MIRILTHVFASFLVLASCSHPEPRKEQVQPIVPTEESGFSFQIFPIIDSLGSMHGMGYDIYNGSKRMIHQTSIPSEQGNEGFISREDAEKVAKLVVSKLELNQGFPTISRADLDSLGITSQHE